MILRLTKILPFIVIMTGVCTLSACAQPNWYKAGKWNYAHQNYTQALPQLLWSAQLGDASAQYAVGYMYYNGLGTPQDDVLAYHWFIKAAKKGNQNAAIALQQIQGIPPQQHRPIHMHPRVIQHTHKPHHMTIIPMPQALTTIKPTTLPSPNSTQKPANNMPVPSQTQTHHASSLPSPTNTG